MIGKCFMIQLLTTILPPFKLWQGDLRQKAVWKQQEMKLYVQYGIQQIFPKAKCMRKMTKKPQTKMITIVLLAAWDYFKCFLILRFSKFSELWYITFKIENAFNSILK